MPSLPQAGDLSSVSLSSRERCSSSSITWMALQWILSSVFVSLLRWGVQNWTQHSRHSLTSAEYRGRISCLHLLVLLHVMESRIPLAIFARPRSWLIFHLESISAPRCFQLDGPHMCWCLGLFLPKCRTLPWWISLGNFTAPWLRFMKNSQHLNKGFTFSHGVSNKGPLHGFRLVHRFLLRLPKKWYLGSGEM